jgi:hypothetical protein
MLSDCLTLHRIRYKAPAIRTTLLVLGKLSTPLFARTTISPLSEFLTPTQDPNCVAKALIDHLERAKGGKIYLPYLARLAPVLKGMPERIRDAVQRVRTFFPPCTKLLV